MRRAAKSAQTRTENGLDTRELVHILDDHASGGKHAHTAVLELSLAEPPNVDEVTDAQGVEANVASLSFEEHVSRDRRTGHAKS